MTSKEIMDWQIEHLTDRGYCPTPQEIAFKAAEIRAGWSDSEREKRYWRKPMAAFLHEMRITKL